MNELKSEEIGDRSVKILFRYYSKVLEQEVVETMWASVIDEAKNLYRLDNIPFYGPAIASDDIVVAEFDETEQSLTYREVYERSGNSIVQVVLLTDSVPIDEIRRNFIQLGCRSERANEKYFSMEVPAQVDYKPVKEKLAEMFKAGLIDYAEPCLSEFHMP